MDDCNWRQVHKKKMPKIFAPLVFDPQEYSGVAKSVKGHNSIGCGARNFQNLIVWGWKIVRVGGVNID